MILKRWLAQRAFGPEVPLCEIQAEGVSRVVRGKEVENDACYIYHTFVQEGCEIGPSGWVFEYIGGPPGPPGPQGPIPLHAKAKLKLTRRERYPKIFLNYRRDDADAYAGRSHEVLAQEFGDDEVFLAEFSIRAGEVWDWTIQQAVVHAKIMLALVGRSWLREEAGKRRIDSAEDVVRRELVGAMDRGTVVIPVLLPEATIPRSADFQWNDSLRLLPELQFHRLAGARHWKSDVGALLTTIKDHLQSEGA